MNAYVTVNLLKNASVLDITGTGDDVRLRLAAENVSRQVDRYVNRHFFALSATRKFDGDGSDRLLIPDLISIDSSGLKTDDNLDRTFETTWATTDYFLYPSNADPTGGHDQCRPYARVLVDVASGSKSAFPVGRQSVQLAGQWGYWRRFKRATEVVNEALDATETGVDVDARTDVEVGHTILVDSEQMYLRSYATNTLTVVRGVNGTTAATHSTGATIDIYEYPGPIVEATIIQVARLWKRKDSAFAATTGFPETGQASLLSNISGLRVLDYPADSVSEFPVAVVLFESRDTQETLGGSTFVGEIKVVLLVSSANTFHAYDTLDLFMDPLGTSSIEASVDADNTWGGNVDDGRLVSVDNVGQRRLWGGIYVGADFHFRFTKAVAG